MSEDISDLVSFSVLFRPALLKGTEQKVCIYGIAIRLLKYTCFNPKVKYEAVLLYIYQKLTGFITTSNKTN